MLYLFFTCSEGVAVVEWLRSQPLDCEVRGSNPGQGRNLKTSHPVFERMGFVLRHRSLLGLHRSSRAYCLVEQEPNKELLFLACYCHVTYGTHYLGCIPGNFVWHLYWTRSSYI